MLCLLCTVTMGFYNLWSVLLQTGTSPSGVLVGENFSNKSNTVILFQVHDIYKQFNSKGGLAILVMKIFPSYLFILISQVFVDSNKSRLYGEQTKYYILKEGDMITDGKKNKVI